MFVKNIIGEKRKGETYTSFFILFIFIFFFLYIFLPQVEVPPSTLNFLQYYTMILQRPRIIVGEAGFEPGTSDSEVWRATKVATTSPSHHISKATTSPKPPHLQILLE